MSKHDQFADVDNYQLPKTMQALIAKGRGFENLEVAEVDIPKGLEPIVFGTNLSNSKISKNFPKNTKCQNR